jgi:type I restriction enzyme M protein
MVESEVATRLWQAANKLWANTGLRPSQFSQPILGIIFLRYAEEMYARAEEELGPVGTGGGAAMKADYQAQGLIFLPHQARYSQLQALPEGFNIGQALNDAMKAIEDEIYDEKCEMAYTHICENNGGVGRSDYGEGAGG